MLWCIYADRSTHKQSISLFHTTKEKVIPFKHYFGEKLPFNVEDIQGVKILKKIIFITLAKSQLTYSYTPKNGFKKLSFLKKGEVVCGISKKQAYWIYDNNAKKLSIRKVDSLGNEIFRIKETNLPTPFKKQFILVNKKNNISFFGYKPEKQDIRHWVTIDENGVLKIEETSFKTDKHKIFSVITSMCKYSKNYKAYWYAIADTCMLFTPENKILYKGLLRVKNNHSSLLDKDIIWQAGLKGFYQIQLKKPKFKKILADKEISFRGITKIDSTIYFSSYENLYTQKDKKNILSFITHRRKNSNTIWTRFGNKLTQHNLRFKKLKTFELKNVNEAEVWALYEDKKGLLWYSNTGLYFLNPKTGNIKSVNTNGFDEIQNSIVYYFYEKEDGNILLCTTTGLYEMSLEKGITARYHNGGKGKNYLPTNDIRHFYIDKKTNNYWFATHGKGLLQWNPTTGKHQTFLFNNSQKNIVHSVYPDDYGFLWLSTENGITQFNIKNHQFKSYSTEDGTSSHEFNRISHFKDNDTGRIYFGSIDGITSFHPKDFYKEFNNKEDVKVIPVEINQFSAKTEKIENTTANFYKNGQVNLYPNDRFLNIKLATSSYEYNEKAVYYYKLKNIDKNWIKVTQNNITLSGLPYGEQLLQVKALLPNGQFTLTSTHIPITIFKPFYLQWWFFITALLVIVASILSYIYWRTHNLEKQKAQLREEVAKRTLKIQQQTEELKELDKTKSRFFANISHELRTPITLIKGPIQSILKNENLTQKDNYLLNKAKNSTNSLLRLVNEILMLTKLEGDKLQLEETTIVLQNFIKQLCSNFQSVADANNIQFVLQYKAEKELQILTDKYKLEKVLNNLLSNAFKFTSEGGKVTLTVEDKGAMLLLKVVDTGRGIPAKDIPHIFERYFQSSKNKKAEGGLGIGLALSMELVKFLKGKMWVESITDTENKGTTFFVELPKTEVMAMLSTNEVLTLEQENTKIEKSKVNEPQKNKHLNTVLLVEDNKDLREYIQLLLSPFYNIITAENGKEALQLLTTNAYPDLIISDLMMPIMDGYELLENVKKNPQTNAIPFIVLTARAELKDKLKAMRIGVDDYLLKPFDEEELLSRTENLLTNYKERLAYIEVQQENDSTISNTKDDKENDWLLLLEKTIKENVDNSLFSNDYLAEIMQVSRKKIYAKIKTLTGLTPNQYIRVIRLQLAKEYLENGTYKTVKEVSNKVGFKKQGHFSNLFKQEFGKSASEYFK